MHARGGRGFRRRRKFAFFWLNLAPRWCPEVLFRCAATRTENKTQKVVDTAENEPNEVFLIWKCVIFGEPQNRGYFRESSYEEAVCGTPLVRSSSNHGLIPYFENVHFWWTPISGVFPRELIRRSGLGDPPLYRVVAIIASFLPWKCSFLGWFRLERKCRSKCGKRVLFKCCWDHFLR